MFWPAYVVSAVPNEKWAEAISETILNTVKTEAKTDAEITFDANHEMAGKVLNFLIEHKGESCTRDQIAEAVGISGAAVSSACKALGDAVCKAEVKIDKARRVVYTLAE